MIGMQKQDHGKSCEELRISMENRAALIYCFVKAARDMGLDYLALGHRAMFESGREKAQTFFTPTDRVDEFSREYMISETLQAFDGRILACTETCLVEESTYCPLVAAWQKMTDDESFMRDLCDIAMSGDRGIMSCYPEFSFTLAGTIFDSGGKCAVRVEKKGK